MSSTFTAPIVSAKEMREDTPLASAVQSFFLSKRKISEATRVWYSNYLTGARGFLAFATENLGREPLISDFDPALASAYLTVIGTTPTKKYPKGSPVSERSAAITVKTFGSWMAKAGIKRNDTGGSVLVEVEQVKVANDRRQPLSESEKQKLIDSAGKPGHMTYALVIFMLGSGLRLNEARELTVADIDFENCTVVVRPETSKGNKGRTVYIHREIAFQVDRYLRNREDNWAQDPRRTPLWVGRSGDQYTIDSFGKVFLRLKNDSGIKDFSAHVCRHTWATDFMKQPGASLLELKRQGGWAKWEMLERYSHAQPPRDREALPNPLSQKPSPVKRTFVTSLPKTASRLRVIEGKEAI